MGIFSVVTGYIKDKFRGGSNTIAINISKSGVKDQTSMSCFGPGIEINPADGENLVLTRMGNSNSFVVSVGGVNQNIEPDTERGERKIYSVSEDGTEIKAFIKLKNDGGIEIISTGTDVTVTNDNGSFSLKENGQFDVNGNFTVDP